MRKVLGTLSSVCINRLCLLLTLVFLFAGAAAADPLGPISIGVYNQQDSPCFLGYSCGPNLGVPMTVLSNPVPDQGTQSSPLYTGTDLTNLKNLVGTHPLIAVDLNQSGTAGSDASYYLIDYIKVYFNGSATPAYEYSSSTAVTDYGAGNGVSEYVIPGLDLTLATTSLLFEVQWGNFGGTFGDNNGGKELFFLVPEGTPAVPEPTTVLLLGSGLLSLGILRLRTRRK